MKALRKYPEIALTVLVLVLAWAVTRLPVAGVEAVTMGTGPSLADVSPTLQTSSRIAHDLEYIDMALEVISDWQPEQVQDLLSMETRQATNARELKQVMQVLAASLGNLEYYETPVLVPLQTTAEVAEGSADLSSYRFIAWYESGPAKVDMMLKEQNGGRQLHSFDIEVIGINKYDNIL